LTYNEVTHSVAKECDKANTNFLWVLRNRTTTENMRTYASFSAWNCTANRAEGCKEEKRWLSF